MEVLLTSQSLLCKSQEAFNNNQSQRSSWRQQTQQQFTNQDWQLIIKVVASINRRTKRSDYAFKATTMEGRSLFKGGANCDRKTYCLALQNAVRESMLKAMELGYNRLLVLNCCKDLTQVCKNYRQPSWQQKTLFADITHLQNQGLHIDFHFVPRYVIGHVSDLG